jgi:hypothetical protein
MRGPAPDRRPRARSTRNARRHGLSLPVLSDPVSSQEVEELACEIAGPSANAEIHELARRIAEAQIDLRRVRHARHAFLASAMGNPGRKVVTQSGGYYCLHARETLKRSLEIGTPAPPAPSTVCNW